MMHPTFYKIALKVELTPAGTVRSVTTDYPERDVTELLTDEQREELATQVRKEIEIDAWRSI